MKRLIFALVLLFCGSAVAAPITTEDLKVGGSPYVDVRLFANFSTAVASSLTSGKTILVSPGTYAVNTLTVPSDRAVRVEKGGQISVNSGKTLTMPVPSAGDYQIFTGSGAVVLSGGGDVRPQWGVTKGGTVRLNPLDFEGSTLSRKIQAAFNYAITTYGYPVTIIVPLNTTGTPYAWDTEVDLSTNSWVTLKSEGIAYVKATGAITCFIKLGVGNKNNETHIEGFSFDAYNQNIDAAIKVGASRGCTYRRIELKGTGTGKFTDGILLNEDIHTGVEAGSGFEQSTIDHVHDSGDGKVYRSIVRVEGARSTQGLTVTNIRATGSNFESVIGTGTGSALNFARITNIEGSFLSTRATKAKAIVHLQGNINHTYISNVSTRNKPEADYAVLVENLVFGTALFLENLGTNYAMGQTSIPSGFINVFKNGVTTNAGNPNEAGLNFNNPALQHEGGMVYDTTNNTFFTKQAGAFVTPTLRYVTQIADDNVLQISLPATSYRSYGSLVSISVEGTTWSGIVFVKTNGVAACTAVAVEANLNVTTGVLTGTTGTDVKVTVSADVATGKIYIENRSGTTRRFIITFLS